MIVLLLIAWLTFRAARVQSTPKKALSATLDLQIWDPSDPNRRGISIRDWNALPLQRGDQIRLRASLSEDAYCYLLWIGADGQPYQ